LDARGSKLMPDKKDFGYAFPATVLVAAAPATSPLGCLLPGYVLDAEHHWLGHLLLALEASGHGKATSLSSMSPLPI